MPPASRVGKGRLGGRVVARDEHGGRGPPTDPASKVAANVVLNACRTWLGQGFDDLSGGGAVDGNGKRVEGVEVQRVGDVDDDLPANGRRAARTLSSAG